MAFELRDYVRVIATGEIGRVESWTSATDQYWVEFNNDFKTRQWFKPIELEPASPSSEKTIS